MIGRDWLSSENEEREDYILQEFISRSLPEEVLRPAAEEQEDEYLSLFIDHALDSGPEAAPPGANISIGNAEIMNSRFFSGFSSFDRSSGIGLIRLTSVKVPVSGIRISSTEAVLLCYTLSGEGDLYTEGRSIRCRKYDCVCVDCRAEPKLRACPGPDWEGVFIRINGRFSSELFSNLCSYISNNTAALLTFGAGTRFRSIIWELLGARADSNPDSVSLYNHLLLGLFLELDMAITFASHKQTIIPDVIMSVQNYLDKNYARDINLDLLAKTFSISKYHMSREFKRCIGKSPIDYLIDVRINRAKTLLYDTNRPVAEICQLVGIPNPNHFLYLFKEREGVTPSAFRKFKL